MRFQVPQFIDIEDKIFGPLTLKQFIYLAGGAGLSFLIYSILKSLALSAIPIIVIMSISAIFAFYKINKKPFIGVVEAAFKYYVGTKIYIWKKEEKKPEASKPEEAADATKYASMTVPKISESQLKDLSWSLDIQESKYAKDVNK